MIFFSINIFPNFFNLFLVIIAASTACTGFGMFLSSISKTSSQANGWGTLLILTMSAIGGAWFPISFMPGYIQFFSKLTLVYWSVDGFLAVLWRGAGLIEILPNLLILFGIAILINIISIFNFRKGNVF
jgi:ABC-2 type transport system permease protein